MQATSQQNLALLVGACLVLLPQTAFGAQRSRKPSPEPKPAFVARARQPERTLGRAVAYYDEDQNTTNIKAIVELQPTGVWTHTLETGVTLNGRDIVEPKYAYIRVTVPKRTEQLPGSEELIIYTDDKKLTVTPYGAADGEIVNSSGKKTVTRGVLYYIPFATYREIAASKELRITFSDIAAAFEADRMSNFRDVVAMIDDSKQPNGR